MGITCSSRRKNKAEILFTQRAKMTGRWLPAAVFLFLTLAQADGYVYGQAAIGGFLVFAVHVQRRIPHGAYHLIQ